MPRPTRSLLSLAVLSCLSLAAPLGATPPPAPASAPAVLPMLTATPIALPGGAPVRMDYFAYDPATRRVWVPAGNSGRVDILEPPTVAGSPSKLTAIEGWKTLEQESPRGKRVVGPSSATVGDGVVYIGNRAGNEICAVDAKSLKPAGCVVLPVMPDGLAYIAATKEIWVTTPRDRSVTILDVSKPTAPALKAKLPIDGHPEGYAVDNAAGIFYTNLEDRDLTIGFDVKSRKQVSTWKPGCAPAEPQGLLLDPKRHLLFVACADHTVALATDQGGAVRGQVATGDGVDVIDYDPGRGLLYAPSGKTAKLSVIEIGPQGSLRVIATAATAEGSRAVVVDGTGTAYVADPSGGRLLAIRPLR